MMNIEDRDPVREELSDLAWFAYDAAPTLCRAETGCLDYHRFWSVARLVELEGRLPRGLEFLTDGFRSIGRDTGSIRVLVAGSADTGVPALVASAAHRAGLTPSVHVVDRCPTPLAQIDRFAAQSGADITTSLGDITALGAGGFDAAVTHNVMGFNSPPGRRALLAGIARALRPGGRLLSIESISDVREPRVPKDAALLAGRVVAKLQAAGALSADRTAEIRSAAEAYFSTTITTLAYPEQALRQDLDAAGLAVRSIDYRRDDTATSPRSQPSTATKKDYAHIVAERGA